MPPFLRAILTALGLTELYTLLLLAPLVHPRHMAVYHWIGPARGLFLPTFLDIALVWAVLTALLYAARRPGRLRSALWVALFLLTPPLIGAQASLLWRLSPPRLSLALVYLVGASAVLAFLLGHRSLHHTWLKAIHFASAILLFFGLGGTLLLAQLVWFAWQARALDTPPPLHHAASPSAKPRILWIVFDELSDQQVFERRLPGLQLPAFDALAAQSTLFTQPVAAGVYTDYVLPSLLTGSPVDTVRSSPAGYLFLHHPDTRQWTPFNPRQTIFQDALDAGYSTAVVGWYLPYCRLLPTVLDRCVGSYEVGTKGGLAPRSSLPVNMAQAFATTAATLLPSLASGRPARGHIADYEALSKAATQLLDDPSATFILLHFPIPHLAGIYNRTTGQLTTGPATYLDNLALADRCLAQLRASLERSGQWDATTVLLMGDHGWRTTLTRNPTWTTEEDRASRGGVFDPRPVYLLKLPNQHTPATLPQPFPALKTRALLDALLQTQVTSPEALSSWVSRQP